MKKKLFVFLILLFGANNLFSQSQNFNREDTLRGSITAERAWWDLVYYHLDIKVNPEDSSIVGKNTIHYLVLEDECVMQIDLQSPLVIEKAVQDEIELKIVKDGNAHFIQLTKEQTPHSIQKVTVFYNGKPRVATNPPWDGGLSWKIDKSGKPFIASSCQGIGASIWWPCKDHPYDEPDSMLISVNVPKGLINVSNGKLLKTEKLRNKTTTFHWFVCNPINNYGVNINIADYAHFSDVYEGENGPLDCNYYVLRENLGKAIEHFKQAHLMLEAFESWFGPYPFYEDGYKLVEVPYAGMEHQSCVTYGNGYRNGFYGDDISYSGWGDRFDFIIVHESGHEWFANSITNKDVADMWIHEGFTNYSENLYVEFFFGKKAGSEYVIGSRRNIKNDRPIIGSYDVCNEGSGDMYYKAGNMLHTLRQIVNDDVVWRNMFRDINVEYFHQTVSSYQIEEFISNYTKLNLKSFFDMYLRDTRIPRFEYAKSKNQIKYRWNNCVEDFEIPLKVYINGAEKWLTPTSEWKIIETETNYTKLEVDPNFYVTEFNITGR